jgi:hypothetical protein
MIICDCLRNRNPLTARIAKSRLLSGLRKDHKDLNYTFLPLCALLFLACFAVTKDLIILPQLDIFITFSHTVF